MIRTSPQSSACNSTELASPPKETTQSTSAKPKKPPPITPRRFTKFFTPRPLQKETDKIRTSRRALQEITRSALNRKRKRPGPPVFGDALPAVKEPATDTPVNRNKRKLSFSSTVCSPRSSPLRKAQFTPSSSQESRAHEVRLSKAHKVFEEEDELSSDEESWDDRLPIRHARQVARGSASLLAARLSGGHARSFVRRVPDWREETVNFYTGPADSHRCRSNDGLHLVLPFCVASCSGKYCCSVPRISWLTTTQTTPS